MFEGREMNEHHEFARRLAEWVASASEDVSLSSRLARAGVVVHVHFGEGAGATLALDRDPVAATPTLEGTPDVELWVTPEQMMQMVRRERHLAMLITAGEIAYRGPVRQFLRVVPLLRALDHSAWRGAGAQAGVVVGVGG